MIEGLSYITFIVKNLERTSNFLTSVFEAEEIYASCEKEYSYSFELHAGTLERRLEAY